MLCCFQVSFENFFHSLLIMDLYLFNTIINTSWYLFTTLFILYKFTSFFSSIYGFVIFCKKLWTGAINIKNKFTTFLQKRNNYSTIRNRFTPPPQTSFINWAYTFPRRCVNAVQQFFVNQPNDYSEDELFHSMLSPLDHDTLHVDLTRFDPMQRSSIFELTEISIGPTVKPFDVENSALLFDSNFIKEQLIQFNDVYSDTNSHVSLLSRSLDNRDASTGSQV